MENIDFFVILIKSHSNLHFRRQYSESLYLFPELLFICQTLYWYENVRDMTFLGGGDGFLSKGASIT